MTKYDIEFDYYHGYESEQFAFYRIPKVLFTDDYFKELSCDAKVLYGLMLDRMSLSVKNRWIDEKDRVYIIFTLEQVMQYMNCGRDKGMKTLAELDTKKGIGLIERIKQGFGKPDIIYVKSFLIKENTISGHKAEDTKNPENGHQEVQIVNDEVSSLEKTTYSGRKNRPLEVEKNDLLELEKTTYPGRKNRPIEVGKTDLLRSEEQTYGSRENRLVKVGKSNSNYTNINNTNINQINLSSDEPGSQKEDKIDEMEIIQIYTDIVKTNIDYEILIQDCESGDRAYIDEIVDLLVETISIKRKTIVIGGAEYPYQFVKNKLLKVNYFHIQYVIGCLHDTTTKVRNVKAYLLTCLFNAPSTIENYYRARVNHDMYGGG